MSFTKGPLWAPTPSTIRGSPTKLGTDPKGQHLVYTTGRGVFIRDIKRPEQAVAYFEHIKETTVAKISPSGFYCASADVNGAVRIWDLAGQDQLLKLETKIIAGRINDLAWDGESKRIIAVGDGKERFGHAFTFDSGSSVGEISGHNKVVNAVAIRHQRPFRAVTGGDDNSLVFLHGVPYKFAKTIKVHTSFVHSVAFSPAGAHFASAGADRKLFVHDGSTGDTLGELNGGGAHTGGIFACSWSADGKQVASSSADMTVTLWDVETRHAVQTWTLSETPSVADQQVGNTWVGDEIVSLSFSGDINIFDPRVPHHPSRKIYGHQKGITALARDPSSGTFVSGSYDGRVNCFSADGECQTVRGAGHSNQVMAIAPSNGRVYTAGMDDALREVTLSSKSFGTAFASTSTLPKALAVDHSGSAFVATQSDLQIINANKKVFGLPVNFAPSALAVSPTSGDVAVGSEDSKVFVYKTDGSKLDLIATLSSNASAVTALAYSPDGNLLAAGESSGKIQVYDTASNMVKISRWVFHSAKISSLAWSPNSLFAASGSLDTNVYIWSVAKPMSRIAIKVSGLHVPKVLVVDSQKLKGAHPGGVAAVTWIDNEAIVTAGADATIRHFKIAHVT